MIIFFPIGGGGGAAAAAVSAADLTASDYVTQALQELGVVGSVDPPSPEDSAVGLGKLNRIFDNLNADRKASYAWEFLTFTLTPNLSPHTIGLAANTPTWAVATNRPQRIYSASLSIAGLVPSNWVPIEVRDATWYDGLAIPDFSASIPTDLYYKPSWPNGELFFWPVPTAALSVTLAVPTLLSQVDLTTVISLPPGYHDALVLTLAEDLQGVMRMALSPSAAKNAQKGRARIFGANSETPRLSTRDSGMPGGGGESFDYRSRSFG